MLLLRGRRLLLLLEGRVRREHPVPQVPEHGLVIAMLEAMVLRVRTQAFGAIMRQPVGWFDSAPDRTAGALANRLSADCYAIKALTGERASIAISQVAILVVGLCGCGPQPSTAEHRHDSALSTAMTQHCPPP